MNLKVRKSQLVNELDRLETMLLESYKNPNSETIITIIMEQAGIRHRIKEIEFLSGDLTKNFNKL